MSMRLEVIETVENLRAITDAWEMLAKDAHTSSLFLGPCWLLAWWRAFQQQLDAELNCLALYEGDSLVGLAPFYSRQAERSPTRKLEELRLMGDAGPRPPTLGILAKPGYGERVGNCIGDHLASHSGTWDVLDLQPLEDPSKVRAFMVNRLNTRGRAMDSSHAGGVLRIEIQAEGGQIASVEDPLAEVSDPEQLRKRLTTLRRLSRLEWAHRDENSPFVDPQATHLMEEISLALGQEGRARCARLNGPDGGAIAAALVLDDDERAAVLAFAFDPAHEDAPSRLLASEAQAARERGRKSLELSAFHDAFELPNMPITVQRAIHLRVYGSSHSAMVARTYGEVRRKVSAAKYAPSVAAAGARAAWSRIRTAATHVAGVDRMHLYRGELWTRGVTSTPGLSLTMFSGADFDALGSEAKEQFLEYLAFDEEGLRRNWERGDLSVVASFDDRPAGIVWCACKRVFVPALDRYLELGQGEAYTHDLYVAPQARGRSVAPSILEFLAKELRQKDIYKSWALIGGDNFASIRAFEKAAYTAVADIVLARIAGVEKLVVRPPDVQAKTLLGI